MTKSKSASEKQKEYIVTLCREVGREVPDLDSLTSSVADGLIKELREFRTPPAATEKQLKLIRALLEYWEGYEVRKPLEELNIREAMQVIQSLDSGVIKPDGLLVEVKPVERGRVVELRPRG